MVLHVCEWRLRNFICGPRPGGEGEGSGGAGAETGMRKDLPDTRIRGRNCVEDKWTKHGYLQVFGDDGGGESDILPERTPS